MCFAVAQAMCRQWALNAHALLGLDRSARIEYRIYVSYEHERATALSFDAQIKMPGHSVRAVKETD